ncbi:MAG: hypothetical protein HW421_2341 [Ignavibacteria bacterium]|nr:hypothetical protein [Ignavibacteria bacterium]
MDKSNNLYRKCLELAKNIVILYRDIDSNKIENDLLKQMLRSGTSVGANVAEAQGSISEPDYVSKMHIAYKELLETEYWIDLFHETEIIPDKRHAELIEQISEVSKILYSITKSIRSKRN